MVPTNPGQCDGNTIQGSTVIVGSDGSVDYMSYTMYSLPNSDLGDRPASQPACDLSDECVLYIGEDHNDFTQPHFWSQGFYVHADSRQHRCQSR